ncbi:Rod shape-determining protein MreD [hydrothermal vent metagenome]|uniref:Rod shape-determining protein MreD n=1 Tax=hydrothermal vent metagenome TaxID=652676 RepID=A0A3B1B6M8_9ZZZZ
MSIHARSRGGWTITFSFIVAMLLSILPLPPWLHNFMPEWLLLVSIYWSMALPHRIGVGVAWGLGLLLDVLRDTLLGQYALVMALVIFITLRLHQRIRVVPLWQQAITIFVLCLIYMLINFWIKGLQGLAPNFGLALISPFVSALVWPLIFLFMRNLRRYYQVN